MYVNLMEWLSTSALAIPGSFSVQTLTIALVSMSKCVCVCLCVHSWAAFAGNFFLLKIKIF